MSIPYHKEFAETTEFPVLVTGVDGIGEHQAVTYEQFVCNLVKDMGSLDNDLTHMTLGIAGESGEIVDAIKKKVIYDKLLDTDNLLEELGDLEFYMAGMRQLLQVSRAEILAMNIAKLEKRYKNGYSDAAAIARADKEKEVTGEYYKGVKGGTPVAINLPTAAVEGTDEMAGLSKEAKALLDSREPTLGPVGSGSLPDLLPP